MAGMNKALILGRLGKDPEVRNFQNGGKVCNLRIATSETWKDRQSGERKEKTEWHTVAIFSEGLVGVAEQYLRKGSKVYIEGKLQTRKWQDQSGADRYSTEVVLQGPGAVMTMLDGAPGAGGCWAAQEADPGWQRGGGSGGDYGRSGGGGGGGGWNQGGGAAGTGAGATGGGSNYDDLDDDIPF